MKLAVRRFALIAVAHPVATSFLVALATRLIVVIATNLLHGGVVVGDEAQYLFLALLASEGELTTQDHLGLTIWGGYGESLFNTTRAFMWPLTALFWLFGPTRLVGQLLVVLLGAVTAAGAAALAHRLLRRPYALGAGLMVALFPSQIFWSSVVLRESLIWAGLAVMAVVVTIWQRKESGIALLLPVAAMALLFVTLVWLREQTAVVSLWCAVPALLFGLSRRGPRILCVTCLAVVSIEVVASVEAMGVVRRGVTSCCSAN